MDTEFIVHGLEKYGIQYQTHTENGLVSHLKGTYSILKQWECSEDLCFAGLCHSVYGTESYKKQTIPLGDRSYLKELIGERSERLVYLFGVHRKDSLWNNLERIDKKYSIQSRLNNQEEKISGEEFKDLIILTLANWLEQRPRAPEEYQFLRKDEFLASKKFLPIAAYNQFLRVYQIH